MLPLAATHAFWITSRAAGVLALLCASLSVSAGLTLGGRMLPRAQRTLRPLHEALSLAALAALALHVVSLLGDAWLHPSLADLAIPFASSFGAPWMAIGIAAGWATALLGLSFYVRARIGVARWRRLHRFTALAWLLSIVHALGMGTDAGTAWFPIAVGIVVVPALALLVARLAEERGAPAPATPEQTTARDRQPVPRLWSGA